MIEAIYEHGDFDKLIGGGLTAANYRSEPHFA